MKRRTRLAGLCGVLVISASLVASSSTNSLRIENVGQIGMTEQAPEANDFRPIECLGFNVTAIVTNESGPDVIGTAANELLLGTPSNTNFVGGGGDDCITLPDSGTANVDGGNGNDVCLGNANTTFVNCETKYRDGVQDTTP